MVETPRTEWRARCFLRACRARDAVRAFTYLDSAHDWATGHAANHGHGGHVVAVWCEVGGVPCLAHLLRYADPIRPVDDWIWWGWACLHCPLGPRAEPHWHEGHLDRNMALTEWRDHECGRTTHEH